MYGLHITNESFFPYLWLIPFLPLVGAAINGIFGAYLMRRFGPAVNHTIAIVAPSLSALIAIFAFTKLLSFEETTRVLRQNLFPFIHLGFLDADIAFLFDPLSATLTLIVTIVGTLIHVYSTGYMAGDSSYWRFFAYLNLFMASMLTLVLGDNFLVMFIGWEGVGLCSYLLISFWYKEKANAVAGMKAFVVNRIGDFGFIIGLAFLFWGLMGDYQGGLGSSDQYQYGEYENHNARTVEQAFLHRQALMGPRAQNQHIPPTSVRFEVVQARVEQNRYFWSEKSITTKTFMGIPIIVLICLFLFMGATGKSAQLPLYVWLPDAMAGPTPVSALIHAATMVTAGVYMVARLHFLFALSPTAMTVVALVGAITALYAATIGLFQYDIKKVLAYSTVSQLGYMFIGVGVGAYWAGIYHLLTHAVFKACLFLGSGSVILACHHEQDMRKMGGLKKHMPLTSLTYFLACIAITTAPFFLISNGFFSKDEILWKAFDAQHLLIPGWSIWLMGFLGAGLTSFYMWRSYYMTFTGSYRGGHEHDHQDSVASEHEHHSKEPKESPRNITWVLATLALLILITIPLGFWPLVGIDAVFEHWLHPVVGSSTDSLTWLSMSHDLVAGLDAHKWEFILAAASILISLGGWFSARILYKDAKSTVPGKLIKHPSPWLQMPHRLIFNKYYVDEIYDFLIVRRTVQLSRFLYRVDQKVIDALVNFVGFLGRLVAALDRGIDVVFVDGSVNGVARVIKFSGQRLRLMQTGRIQTYVSGVMLGAIVLLLINYFLLI